MGERGPTERSGPGAKRRTRLIVTNSDMSGQERQIDDLVYDLYGLTEEGAALGRAIDAALAEEPDGYVSEDTIMATLRDLDAG